MTSRGKLLRSTMLCGLALTLSPSAFADIILNATQSDTITGAETHTTVIIGDTSGPATLTVTSSGTLQSDSGNLGYFINADNNSALIEGDWTNTGTITVGNLGSGNTLTIQGGGTVSSKSTWIGGESASTGNTVIVSGSGSKLDNSTDVTVGYGSTGNSLTIQNGASSTNYSGYIGYEADADSNTLTVTGEGSSFAIKNDTLFPDSTGVMYLGFNGSSNSLNVLDEASVKVDDDMLLGTRAGSNDNTLNISGVNSKVSVGSTFYVGRSGEGNSVLIENGGTLETGAARIGGGTGANAASSNNSVTIRGTNSTWKNSGTLRIGSGTISPTVYASSNNSLHIEAGGKFILTDDTIPYANTFIGYEQSDENNKLVVSGEGSSFTTNGSILVGARSGSEATNSLLEIDDGGFVGAGAISVGGTSTLRLGSGGSLESTQLTLSNGSLTQIEIDFENPVSIFVNGTATLDGDLEAIVGPKGIQGNRYTLLTSTNPIVGEFDNRVIVGLSPNISYTYGTSSVERYLTFSMDLGGGGDFDENQQNVADVLDDYFNAGGILAPGFGVLASLTGEELAEGLSQASGEVGATGGAKAVQQATTSFLDLMMQPRAPGQQDSQMAAARVGDVSVMPTADIIADDTGWTMWGGVYGGTASLPGDSVKGSHDTDTDALGIATGWDYAVSAETTVGFAIAGGGTRWDLDDNLGSGDSTFLQFGVHGTQRFGASYLSLAGAYAWHWMETERTVTIDGSEQLDADFDAGNLAGRVEGGHRFGEDGAFGLTPYAALQAQAVYMPDYEENGGDFEVAYDAETATAIRSELGLRFDMMADAVRLNAGLAWAHDWSSDGDITASFQSLSGTSFIVNGAESPDDVALVSAGAEFGLGSRTSLTASFDGEFGQDYASYGGSLVLSHNW